MAPRNVVRLVGGDSDGKMLTGGPFHEGDIIKRFKSRPYEPRRVVAEDQLISNVSISAEVDYYEVHNFRTGENSLLFAAPKGWTAADIQEELWRHYCSHEEMHIETETSDRDRNG